ncbi:MAG: SprB repeat-containing protein, partial [Bacteroidales bacterium]|nr:SprB repeat-containing protein [Bacteroidales bacterium]
MKKQAILFIICYILTSISLVSGQCSFTISSTNVFCYGDSNGTATANPMTGIPPFTFLWNTTPTQDSSTAINLSVGTYTVNVTDSAGCIVADSVIITQPDLLIDTIISVDTICVGNCATLNAAVTGGT